MNKLRFVKLYHVTTPEIAPVIMREGFRDHAAQKGVPGFGVTHTFDPGVWFADVPPITAISVDQFMAHVDEAWIAVFITEDDYWQYFRGNEWQDESWPTRQWLIPAAHANQFPRSEVALAQILRQRIDDTLTAEVLSELIETDLSDDGIKACWRTALTAATAEIEQADPARVG